MKIVLFDIDGTLLASGGAGKAALESAFQAEFAPLTHQVPYAGRTDRAIMRELFRSHGLDDTDANVARLMASYLSRLPASLETRDGRVLPGIASLLDWLGTQPGWHVGLLTGNVRAGARVKLGHFGLYDRFAFGGFGDRHYDRDDVAREALEAAREHVARDVEPDRVWVVGDTPLDVQCARAIGARVAAVATGQHTVEQLAACRPDVVLADLADPAPLLGAWANA